MKIYFKLCIITVFLTLFSANTYAFRDCRNGDTPKFRNNTATFYVEPLLWNHDKTREAIVNAFNDWNQATGWMMNFIVLPAASNGGDYNDEVFQVRTGWIKYQEDDNGTIDSYLAQNVGLSTREVDQQCYWWDNDIVISKNYMRDGVYSYDRMSMYVLMLHEISHAMGFSHNESLSVVNPKNYGNTGRGLFGYDIQAARQLYSAYAENLRRNFRADDVMLQGTEMRSVDNVGVGSQFFNSNGFAVRDLILPYNVTNTGQSSEHVNIELLGARNEWELYNGEPIVLSRFRQYIGAGETATGWKRFNVSSGTLEQIHQYGFRVLANDDIPSDNIRAVR